DFSVWIDAARAADHYAQIVFEKSLLKPFPPEPRRSWAQIHGRQVNRARSRHHRIGPGAKFEQKLTVPVAAEGNKNAIGGRQFPIGGHSDIKVDEGPGLWTLDLGLWTHKRSIASP